MTILDRQGLSVNPKAIERKAREARERSCREAEMMEPWSREKIDRIRARMKASRQENPGDLSGVTSALRIDLFRADLHGKSLHGVNLSFADIQEANLSESDFRGSNLFRSNLYHANLRGAIFIGCNLSEVNLSRSCLCDADFTEALLRGANLSGCCYEGAKGLDLKEVRMTAAELGLVKYMKTKGFRVSVNMDQGVAIHVGSQLEGSNVADIRSRHSG